ncbi:lysozyme inhibitor LprI family protein [Janthinobacterium fluminis]|uniref:Lysozyme inhibitor LprI family protein n=1 Tax=Janthinobacterium fluminis TaxID=2987524 RepID=A0ABT5K215_9BURK|nr:lysozyme inhibitor LprI family protein [Janthinobacterium fluminis]MDC8759022.1 lysozyme inhibitor LprI family protein [Janthinobacterium fluminis]
MKPSTALCNALLLAGVLTAGAVFSADAPIYPNTSGMGDVPKGAEWYRQCLRVEKAMPPAADLPDAQSVAALKGCNAEERYYDTRNKVGASAADWQQVRQCAFAKGDDGVLMMLYANGLGVVRHPELALKYACSLPGAGAEMDGRVEHLLALGKGGKAETFDLCDDITSGYMQGVCTAIGERQQAKARGRQLGAVVQGWPPQHKAALDTAQLALDAFARARGDEETDLSGTARAAMAIAATAAEATLFAQDIRDFEQGKTPRHSAAQFAAADRELNAIYQKIMKLPGTGEQGLVSPYTTVTKDNVRHTQRAWLKYRDALVRFGALRYPLVPVQAWQAMLTQRRVQQLHELAQP